MPEKKSSQIVTRGAARNASQEAERARAAAANATANVQTAPSDNLNTARWRPTRSTYARQSAIVSVGAASHPTERDSVEGQNPPSPAGPSILNTPFRTDREDANEDQGFPMEYQQQQDQAQLTSEGKPWSPEHEKPTPSLEQGSESSEMASMKQTARNCDHIDHDTRNPSHVKLSTIAHERIFVDQCTSPWCPVPRTIPHERGFYAHGHFTPQVGREWWGLSDPPPAVWLMADRIKNRTEQPGDRMAVAGFVQEHKFLPEEDDPDWERGNRKRNKGPYTSWNFHQTPLYKELERW
ncbi:hypothetical protein MMC07_000817 [Pseudocyphellaria aurata]|nr:hypothetical protein [Pseudocyphellaria aurata]